jgi:hypothetical protein
VKFYLLVSPCLQVFASHQIFSVITHSLFVEPGNTCIDVSVFSAVANMCGLGGGGYLKLLKEL